MLCALGYGLLAGMGVPTQRSLLMIATVLLARYTRRGVGAVHALALAATVILIVDPMAVLAAGFWLSFVGVAVLLSMTRPAGLLIVPIESRNKTKTAVWRSRQRSIYIE
jgi:competence protein ComEC